MKEFYNGKEREKWKTLNLNYIFQHNKNKGKENSKYRRQERRDGNPFEINTNES